MLREFTNAARVAVFWSRVPKGAGCWVWAGNVHVSGYGRFGIGGHKEYAHRVAWWLLRGDIPDGTELDHLCRNRRCVRPEHLEPVTHLVNTLRGENFIALQARATHCRRGHEFTPENTIVHTWHTKTMRRCRVCTQERYRRSGS